MKKNIKLLSALSLVSLMAVTSCGGNNTINLEKNAPDYTRKNAQFVTWGYTPPTNGKYYENGLEIDTGVDNRTKERYAEYKEAGLNVLMLQNEDAYDYNKPWAESTLKMRMDTIQEAGLDKIIVCDTRLMDLCNATTPLIGQDGLEIKSSTGGKLLGGITQFKTIEELANYIGGLMHNYYLHPAFFGVIIRDEPYYEHLENWCYVYKAIKTYDSNIFIEGNLLPQSETEDHIKRLVPDSMKAELLEQFQTDPQGACEIAYRYYLNYYFDHSGANRIMMDSYPFLKSSSGSYFKDSHLRGLQVIGDICRTRGAEFDGVAQTFGGLSSGIRRWDSVNAASMQWQMNCYLAYGCTSFGYFTYWRKVWNNNQKGGEWFNDGESFITNKGERTQLYYTMQSIHKEIQNMAPVMVNYNYSASRTFIQEPCLYPTQYADIKAEEFDLIKEGDFTANEGSISLVNELIDENSGQYMYAVTNIANPNLKQEANDLMLNFSINFGKEYNAVEVYYRGQRSLLKLNDGVYTSSLDAGYAEYIMPYKA